MQSNRKYLLYAIAFFLSVVIGFGVTKLVKRTDEMPPVENETFGKEDYPLKDTLPPVIELDTESPIPLPVVIIIDEKQQEGNNYILKVHAENVPSIVKTLFTIDPIGKISTDGYFSNIPGIPSGKYIVRVIDSLTREELANMEVGGFNEVEPAPQKQETNKSVMSAEEFQALLLNQNDNSLLGGKNPKVARAVNIRTLGLNEGERMPDDILAVREKIANGIWTSARVVGIGYDSSGRINSVTIQPIY